MVQPPYLLELVRIYEDFEDILGLVQSLRRLVLLELSNSQRRFVEVLTHICDHWDDYRRFKIYFSQLRWSFWLLLRKDAVSPVNLMGAAAVEGVLSLDLSELLILANTARPIETPNITISRQKVWSFGEEGIVTILDALSPRSTPLARLARAAESERISQISVIRQHITRLVFPSVEGQKFVATVLLDMLDEDQSLFEETKLSLAILFDKSGMKAGLTSYILTRPVISEKNLP